MMLRGRAPYELRVPTLLLMGQKSAVQRALAPRPSPGLRVETIEGAGHFLPEEAPERVHELVAGHLA